MMPGISHLRTRAAPGILSGRETRSTRLYGKASLYFPSWAHRSSRRVVIAVSSEVDDVVSHRSWRWDSAGGSLLPEQRLTVNTSTHAKTVQSDKSKRKLVAECFSR